MSANASKVLGTGPAASPVDHLVLMSASGGRFLCYPTSQVRKLRLSGECGPQSHSSQGKPHCAAKRSGPGAHTPDHQALLPVVSKLLLPHNPFFRRNVR